MWSFKKLSDIISLKNRIPLKRYAENDLLRLHEKDIDISFAKKFLRQPFVNANTMITYSRSARTTTLLWVAVYNQDEELIDYLVAKGADVNLKSPSDIGGTPLEVALLLRNSAIFKKLHQLGADINIPLGEPDLTLLLKAFKLGRSEITEYLIKNGADVNAVTFNGFYICALHYAAKDSPRDIVKLLLDHNADIHVPTLDGETALTIAIRQNEVDVVKLLIDREANIFYRRSNNTTILHDFADRMVYEYSGYHLELWLQAYANLLSLDELTTDINIAMNDGKSLLHYSLIKGKVELIELLLDAGVDVNAATKGYTLAIEIIYDVKGNFIDNSVLKEHIVKLISAGLNVCGRNKRAVWVGFENYKIECLKEVEKMKITRVGDSNISFLDVLSKNVHSLSIPLRLTDLYEVLNKKKLCREYPLYGGMLFYKLSKVDRRIDYLRKLEATVEEMLCCYVGLPYYFVRDLWIYFSNIELKKCSNVHSSKTLFCYSKYFF